MKNAEKLLNKKDITQNICKEKGISPTKKFSGKFNLRVSEKLHSQIVVEAASEGKSINQWVIDSLSQSVENNQRL